MPAAPDRDDDDRAGESRTPRDYRPDLRPLVLLVGLLALVVVAWVVLSPLILPDT